MWFSPVWMELLLDMTVKGSVVLGAALMLLLILKRLSPASRYLFLFCAVLGVLALPLLVQILPKWEVSFYPQVLSQKSNLYESPIHKGLDSSGLATVFPLDPVYDLESAGRSFSWWQIFLMVWWLGFVGVSFRLAFGLIRTWWIRTRAVLMHDPELLAFIQRHANARPIRLMESRKVSIPLAVGWLRPVILVPPEFVSWDPSKQKLVLLHEIAHIKRGDVFSALLSHMASILNWFNPLVWVAMRRLYVEREKACDDYVLAQGVKPSGYASHLLDIATKLRTVRWLLPAGVAMARRSNLEVRVMSILNHSLRKSIPSKLNSIMAGILVLCLVVPLAVVQTGAQNDDTPGIVQSETEIIKNTLKKFYQTIQNRQFVAALDFFADISEYEEIEKFPLSIILADEKTGKKQFSVLAGDKFQKIEIVSSPKSIKKQDDTYTVIEDLRIMGTTSEGKEKVLVENPSHSITLVQEEGKWKIKAKSKINIVINISEGEESQKIGLCFERSGVRCLVVSTSFEDTLKVGVKIKDVNYNLNLREAIKVNLNSIIKLCVAKRIKVKRQDL